jgi:hypothetical protein
MLRSRWISYLASLSLAVLVLRGCGGDQAPKHCEADSCSGHGNCVEIGGTIACECDVGYAGERCDSCADGYHDYGGQECLPSDPCADDTECAALNRVCMNDLGSAVCGRCLPGYHDEDGACVEDESCLPTSCSGHGTCDDTGGVVTCDCDDHYTGEHCDTCEDGYVFWPADSGTCVDDPCDPYPCNLPNAVADGCVQTGVDAFECTCEAGYSWDGAACVVDCLDADNDGYGTGSGCAGADCDDNDPDVFEGNPDICDGKDNDCDPASADGSEDPQVGRACDGTDSDLCAEGTYGCPAGSLQCSDATGDDLDVCDGEDNDCDPASADGDEDPLAGQACDGTDSDLCAEGTYVCSAGSMQCSDNTGDDLDLCDGEDNDCDPASADGDEDPLAGQACDGTDSDLCAEGTYVCSAGSMQCSDNTGDDLDLCDGVDNDCNPASADGADESTLGDPCDGADSDLCAEGSRFCAGASGMQCDDVTANTLDLCNGLDDDCNPATADGSDEATLGDPCDGADSDLCAEGSRFCAGASGMQCDDVTANTLDLCNGVDDDCNPATADGADEANLGDPCDGPDSDLCAEGSIYCAGAGGMQCNDITGDSPEICGNGIDDDCDGSTDEGCCSNTLLDGGFELGTPNPSWDETSTNFGTPICDVVSCGFGGGTGPYQGTYWAWFGGADNEEGTVSQTVVIPVGANTLRFYMELPVCEAGSYDWFEIRIDGSQVYYTDGNDPHCNTTGYQQRNVDISTYANGASHTILLRGYNDISNTTNFFVDNVELVCD